MPTIAAPGEGQPPADRIGFARLTKFAFDGFDLRPVRDEILARIAEGSATAGEVLDLALIVQLLGDKPAGLSIQTEVLGFHRLFRSPCDSLPPSLRLLALAADIDMGGNTPIDFLLEGSGIELTTLYVVAGQPLPEALPEHDVAIIVASDSEECRPALAAIEEALPQWPRPLLNAPQAIARLDRDKLWRVLDGIEGLEIPRTVPVGRADLAAIAAGLCDPAGLDTDLCFPLIARPRGSHAGVGLARIATAGDLQAYLSGRTEQEFFVSRFVDYASADGQFRKYRVAFVAGRPFAVHMAIADQWNIWYLNAGMSFSEEKRAEEARFMDRFDEEFGARHTRALTGLAAAVGLDYFTLDCAETREGRLLVFEADNTAVVHNMDPADLFPYKGPQMRKIFAAFAAMLRARAGDLKATAAA
jgi:hypothetical protein